PDLLRVVVGNGVSVLDVPHPIGGAGCEQQSLGQRGLTGATMPDQHDVPDLGWLVDVHRSLPGSCAPDDTLRPTWAVLEPVCIACRTELAPRRSFSSFRRPFVAASRR